MENLELMEVGSFAGEPSVWSGNLEMTSWVGVRQMVAEELHHHTLQNGVYVEKLKVSQQQTQLLAKLLQALWEEERSWEE